MTLAREVSYLAVGGPLEPCPQSPAASAWEQGASSRGSRGCPPLVMG